MSSSQPPKKPATPPGADAPGPADALGPHDFDFSYLETADMEELLSADLRAVFERMAEASAAEKPKKKPQPKQRKSA